MLLLFFIKKTIKSEQKGREIPKELRSLAIPSKTRFVEILKILEEIYRLNSRYH